MLQYLLALEIMNEKPIDEVVADATSGKTFGHLCLRSCKKILAGIIRARSGLLAEARHALSAHERMLRLALNEAEALAWQTAYPHLLFPALATEKIQALADWNRHQQAIRQLEPLSALAA